jgi:hypothetical protein
MSDKQYKLIRKQLRNVCQEMAPDILKQEVFEQIYNKVREEVINRMAVIQTQVKQSLEEMEQRQKHVQSLLVRELTANQQFAPVNQQSKE